MRLLVDTHAILWALYDHARLSKKAARRLTQPDTNISLSIASLWEIAIKSSSEKLKLGRSYKEFLDEFILSHPIQIEPITTKTLVENEKLPWHLRDPFDRLIIAQALDLDVPVITADESFARYGVKVFW